MGVRGAMLVMAAAALVFLAVAPVAESAISCGQVYGEVSPCINYVLYGGVPPPQCCQGVRNLLVAAVSRSDRQSICRCLKNAAQGISGRTIEAAASIPRKCKLSISYKISPTTDCSRVN
ncbi:unnamed protein product [Spirodela intermedia]|uniref:Non-specific lipid-transfer protein n=1 Tax=Spirodela intermedia TaxID=51605 RepID=A0A7I8JZ93_SPIIN|nr:unnamed protein product [Spirodela intermedia]